MPGNRKNFSYFLYTDDDAVDWSLRGESGGAFTAVDGNSPAVLTNPTWNRTQKNQPRRVVAQDAATGRIAVGVVYTPTAFSALSVGDTVAVQVPGSGTSVNYTVTRKLGEQKRTPPAFSRHLAD